MKNSTLSNYELTKKELIMLWLNNYEFCESLKDITDWTKYHSIDEFTQRLVRCKEKEQDDVFQFRLILNEEEEEALKEYLSKRKNFVLRYIKDMECCLPYTHLYQLYLQYLSYELIDDDKKFLSERYLHMLADSQGENYAIAKRGQLQKKLNLR